MNPLDIELLCTGDLHLGRHPTQIPQALDGDSFSPRAVWNSTVDSAIDEDVDAVLISGDVVDRDNRYIEAYGAFEEGVTRLDAAGIPTVVVAGNHDFDALPQLVSDLDLDTLTLLGADGEWERYTVRRDGDPLVHVDGWSFPQSHVLESPLETYDLDDTETPVIGLMHGDLGTQNSRYAPIEWSDLASGAVDSWVLGHIHSPGVRVESDPLVFYPGSPQPLDPGEPSAHGPWLLECGGLDRIDVTHHPFASVRYDTLEVDVSDVDDPRTITATIQDQIHDHVTTDVDTSTLELLLCRVDLTGRTSIHSEITETREQLEEQLQFKSGSLPVRVTDVRVETKTEADLAELAEGSSPIAYLADLLLALENDEAGEDHAALLEEATGAMAEAHDAGAYAPLRRDRQVDPPDQADAAALLQQQGRVVLHELLEQREGTA